MGVSRPQGSEVSGREDPGSAIAGRTCPQEADQGRAVQGARRTPDRETETASVPPARLAAGVAVHTTESSTALAVFTQGQGQMAKVSSVT